jgi:hypothetical protein
LIVALERWHGPIVLALSAGHGVDTGALPAAPFAVMAIGVARKRFGQRLSAPAGRVVAWPAIALGVVLLLAGVLTRERGPLMPAGGGILDRTLTQAVDARPVPVGRWTHLRWSAEAPVGERRPGVAPSRRRPASDAREPALDRRQPALRRALPRADRRRPRSTVAHSRPRLDASGHGNTGEIAGATWARGRHGDALRFDAAEAVVRIPPAPSLNLTRTMTLSAWIRPDGPQKGWRTIVQGRQTRTSSRRAATG